MRKLTHKQRRVLTLIVKDPAIKYMTIMKRLKFGNVGSVQSVVRALALKGYIELYKVDGKFNVLKTVES